MPRACASRHKQGLERLQCVPALVAGGCEADPSVRAAGTAEGLSRMTWRFFVPGVLPAQNEMIAKAKGYGGRGLGYSRMKAEWTATIAWIIKAAHIPHMERIRLEFDWVSKDKRHDPDNIEAGQKFIWDSLKLAGVIDNDGWAQNAGTTHRHRIAEKPGVWVTVIPEQA